MATSFNENQTTNSIRVPGNEESRQRFSLGPTHNMFMDQMLESLEELLKKTWNIWGVSCLFGFESDELKLKLYAKRLREEVAAILPHENVTYDAQFTVMENIETRPSRHDHPPIKIEVFSQTDKDNEQKNVYTGIFISWRTNLTLNLSCVNSTKLPLLLCRGTKSAMNAVQTIVGRMFDCQMISLTATEDDFEWLLPMMLNSTDDATMEKGEICMEYRIPSFSESESIAVKFDVPALLKMWLAVCSNDEDESETQYVLKAERISKFHEVIKTQMLHVAGLQLGLCELYKISLPSFTMIGNRIKASTTDAMHRFLLFFNDKSLISLYALDYDTTEAVSSLTLTS